MPLYEYKCLKCAQVFEVLQKFSDTPVAIHPDCGGVVERLISSSAFQFKGSGFYITDYKKTGSSKSESKKSESKNDSKTETKTETKTDTPKPAAKPTETK
jgi:putative FmdB family regulatory protein